MKSSKNQIEISVEGSEANQKNLPTSGMKLSGTGMSFADHSQVLSPNIKKETLKLDAFNQTDEENF